MKPRLVLRPRGPVTTDSDNDRLGRGPDAAAQARRWDVKTGTDAAAAGVVLTPQAGTVAQLGALVAPHRPQGRTGPVEFQVYAVAGTLVRWKIEAEGDYHLVLVDGGQSMVVELPDPAHVGAGSPFAAAIAVARREFVQAARLDRAVVVTGVGFWDHLHGQVGAAPNGIELHPILSIALVTGAGA